MSAHGESSTVGVTIRTAAGEEDRAEELATQLDGALIRISRVGAGTEAGSAAAAWRPWTRRATHHLVLDASARPHPEFLSQIHDAVAGRPDAGLTLFTPAGGYSSHAVRMAAFAGRPWVVSPGVEPFSGATVLPSRAAADFARCFAQGSAGAESAALHRFTRERHLLVLASSPDLVQRDMTGAQAQATAFVSGEVATADWWRREAMPAPLRIPVVHLRDGEPVSYEAGAGANGDWRLRARRDVPTRHPRWLARAMRERLLGTETARSDLRAAAVLLGVAGVLRDQLLLASAQGRPSNGFGTAVARESAATLAVGTLGQVIPAVTRPDRAAELRDAFRALHDEMTGILLGSRLGSARRADP